MSQPTGELILKGINASPGICIGKAYLVDKEGVDIVARYFIEKNKRQSEIKRFKAAVKRARDEIRSVIDGSPEELQRAHILETHLALLKDKMLYGKTIEIIETDGFNAEWALKQVVSNLKAVFLGMADAYLKERASDIVHVSDSIMRNLVGAKAEKIADIDKRVILVARDLRAAIRVACGTGSGSMRYTFPGRVTTNTVSPLTTGDTSISDSTRTCHSMFRSRRSIFRTVPEVVPAII